MPRLRTLLKIRLHCRSFSVSFFYRILPDNFSGDLYLIWHHPFSMCATFFRKTNISYPQIRTHTYVRNVSFTEYIAFVLNGWYLLAYHVIATLKKSLSELFPENYPKFLAKLYLRKNQQNESFIKPVLRRIQNLVKHLRWSLFRKELTAVNSFRKKLHSIDIIQGSEYGSGLC